MNPTDNTPNIKGSEDELSAGIDHLDRKELPDDDSFKTPPRKNRLGWESPMDEQMYQSFDDIRRQNPDAADHPEDEEAD